MPRRATILLTLLTAVAGVLSVAPSAGATVPAGNLILNPGAEAAPGATSSGAKVAVPNWTPTTTFTSVSYAAGSGFPDATEAARIGGGTNFFSGGPDSDTATGTQDINVTGAAAEIDAGAVSATLSAQLGGFESQEDAATVGVAFLGAAGNDLGGPAAVGPVSAADRTSKTQFVARSATAAVPRGTRTMRVTISAVRRNGTYNDGYADNLSLTLTGPAPAPLPPAAKVVQLPGAKACFSKRSFRIRLRQPGGLKIAKADVFVNGKSVKVVTGARVTAPVDLRNLPKGRFIVRIKVTATDGRTLTGTRKYRTCAKKRHGSGSPKL